MAQDKTSLRLGNISSWFLATIAITLLALIVALIPWSPLSIIGGVALLTLLPGIQLTKWLGLWQGWRHPPGLVLSLALGLVVAPLLLFWTGWLFGFSRLETFVASTLFILLTAWLNSRYPYHPTEQVTSSQPQARSNRSRFDWFWLIILFLLTIAILLAYTEGQTELGSYPIQMGDWVKHHGVTWSLRHTGLPPTNVFFLGMAPGERLSYYYFLHLTIASLDIVRGGLSNIHGTFVVITVLASLCFATVFYLLAWDLFNDRWAARSALLFATFIGGLDIIPAVRQATLKYSDKPLTNILLLPPEHIDNWTPTQHLRLSTFMAHYLWVPQHLTGLLIVALGLYLYRIVPSRRRLLPVLALLVAALLGHSTWIALVIFITLPLFAIYQVIHTWKTGTRTDAIRLLGSYILVATGALIIILPFALTLLNNGTAQAGIAFEIPHNLSNWAVLSPFSSHFPESKVAQLLDVPLHYFVEMGALLVGGLLGWWYFWRQHKQHPLLPFLSLLLMVGFGAITFFAAGRSHVDLGLTLNNDLGLRAIMPAQMALALFAGYYLADAGRTKRWQLVIIVPLIVVGVASSAWEVLAMGVSKYSRPPQIPTNVFQAFQALPENTSPDLAVVQHRIHDDFSRVQPDYADRFNGYSTSEAISVGSATPRDLALAIELAKQAFLNRLPLRSYQLFWSLGADYAFVGPTEQEPDFYPEKFRHPLYFAPVYDQNNVAVFEIQPLFSSEPLATFDNNAIEFLGYLIDATATFPGEEPTGSDQNHNPTPGFVTAWRLTRPADKDYTVFIHLVDAQGNIIAQADHQLWAWDVTSEGPTTSWTPGLPHLDIIPVPEAALAAAKPLTIRLGLWLPATEQHFQPSPVSLDTDEAGRLIVGELN